MKTGWKILPFEEVIADVSGGNMKTPQGEFLSEGQFAIVDQGKELISGYANEEMRLCHADLPVIIFGDHTRCFKYVDFPFCMGADGVKVLRPKIDADVKYLYYYLRQLHITDAGYSRHFKYLKQSEVVLPPLDEQKRVADILDRAEALRAKRQESLAQLDELTQSIFIEMFGDPVKNPKNWNIKKVQDVMSQIEAGWSANGESRPREENEYAVLKVSAVTQGVFLPEECKVINNDIEFKKVITPEKGDVLFSRANTLELVGASCLIRENYPYLLLPDKLWKIKVNQEKICPDYFKFILSHPTIRHDISKRSTGTSGSMYNISMEKFRQIDITVPPIEIQKKFSIIIGKIEKIKQSQQQSLLELNNLFDSLAHEAFTGKLFSHQFFEQEIENGVKI